VTEEYKHVEVSALNNGMYIVILKYQNGFLVKKLMKSID